MQGISFFARHRYVVYSEQEPSRFSNLRIAAETAVSRGGYVIDETKPQLLRYDLPACKSIVLPPVR